MRLLWVDRVLELRHAERALTALDLSPDETFLANHFPLQPILPASALFEAFAQTGTILLETSHGFTRKGLPGFFENAKFYRAVRPGSPLEIEVCVQQWSAEGAVLTGQARQEGLRSAACRFGMFTAPLSEFYGPEHMAAYRAFYARLLETALLEGFERNPLEHLVHVAAS